MRRRSLLAMLVVGVVLLAAPAVALAQTATDTQVEYFEAAADAAGIGIAFGNPGSQPNPTAAGLVPNARAELGAGPSGRALSSILWPGDLAANAGTLATLVGVPLPPELLTSANYPVRAEARASGGGRDEQALGPMSAVVDGGESTARTALTDIDAPGLVSAARVVTRSRSYLEEGKVVSIGETELQGVEIADLIRIDTIRTIARGETDGQAATTDHEVVVSGVTVQGQGATIDQDGLHLGPQAADNPLTPAAEGLNQALASSGMEVFVTRPLEQTGDGGAGRVSSGAVVFHWKLGSAGDYLTVVLGGASADVKATPGSSFDLGGDLGALTGGDTGGFTDPGSATLPDLGAAPSIDTGSAGADEAVAPAPIGFTDGSPVSDRVPLGWVLVGALGMLLIGSSLHGLRATAIAAAMTGTTCPLERGAS